jgi:hypothetical protein
MSQRGKIIESSISDFFRVRMPSTGHPAKGKSARTTRILRAEADVGVSVAPKEDAEKAWKEAAERNYAERIADGNLTDNTIYAGMPERAHELQTIADWQRLHALGDKAPRGAIALSNRRLGAARKAMRAMPTPQKKKFAVTQKPAASDRISSVRAPASVPTESMSSQKTSDDGERFKPNVSVSVSTQKRGRPPVGGAAMTSAERSRRKRAARDAEIATALRVLASFADSFAELDAREAAFVLALHEEDINSVRRVVATYGVNYHFVRAIDFCAPHMDEARQMAVRTKARTVEMRAAKA